MLSGLKNKSYCFFSLTVIGLNCANYSWNKVILNKYAKWILKKCYFNLCFTFWFLNSQIAKFSNSTKREQNNKSNMCHSILQLLFEKLKNVCHRFKSNSEKSLIFDDKICFHQVTIRDCQNYLLQQQQMSKSVK